MLSRKNTDRSRTRPRLPKSAALAMVCLAALTACGGSAESVLENERERAPEVFGSGDSFSIEAALREMPLVDHVDDRERLRIDVADLAAASQFLGVDQPVGSDDGLVVSSWLRSITGYDGSGVFVPVPREFSLTAARVGEVRDDMGFAIADVGAMVSLEAWSEQHTVFAGELEPAASNEVAEGVFALGDGADSDSQTDAGQDLRPLFATKDHLVFRSRWSDRAVDWLSAEGPLLSDDADLLAVARVLDERNVIGATVIREKFEPAKADDQVPIKTPFQTVGIGWSVVGGELAVTMAYVFVDESMAATARGQIEAAFSAPTSINRRSLVSDVVALSEVGVEGRFVIVELAIPTIGAPQDLMKMYALKDPLFVHSP